MTGFRAQRALLAATAMLLALDGLAADTRLQTIDNAIAATEFERALELIQAERKEKPDDTALMVRLARMQSYTGDDDAALVTLSELRDRYPDDVDHALARAHVLARLGRDREALEDIGIAAELAPQYEDVRRLQFMLLVRQEDEISKQQQKQLAWEAAIRFPLASWWHVPEKPGLGKWTVLVGGTHESLSNDLPSWNQQFAEVNLDRGSQGRYRAGIARDQRFDNADLSLLLGGDFNVGSVWTAGFVLNVATDPDFQPDLGYSAFAGRSLVDDWNASIRYQRREYETATVGSFIGTAEKYFGDFRIAYSLGVSHLHGAGNSLNHTATANWYYSESASVGLTINAGEEAEAIGAGRVLQTDVRGLSVTGRREFSERLGMQWWLGLHEQGDFYRRLYLGMAFSIGL